MKLTPFLMFEGQAEEAMDFYLSLFPNSAVNDVTRYGPNEGGVEGALQRARFTLNGRAFQCFNSPAPHAFGFTPAISIFVDCDTEEEVETLTAKLSEGGSFLMPLDSYPFSKKFAWLVDRFGVSWQLYLPPA